VTGEASDELPVAEQPGTERLEKLLEVGRSLVSDLDLGSTLTRMLELGRELTGARFAAVGIFATDRRELEHFLTSGAEPRGGSRTEAPAGFELLELVGESAQPLRLVDVRDHPAAAWLGAADQEPTPFLGVPVVVRDRTCGAFGMTKSGEPFGAEDERTVIALASWAAVAIQNVRLHEASERHRRHLGHAVRGLEATVSIARAIDGETQLDRVLGLIAERGRALIEARGMVIVLAEGDELVFSACAGDVGAAHLGRRVPLGGSVIARVLASGEVERVIDPFGAADPDPTGILGSEALVVPLRHRGRAFGTMVAFAPFGQPDGFHAEQAELLGSVAASAAVAVWTARTVEDDRARRGLQAAEAERTRWARELHDGTLQGLGALQISVASARRVSDPAVRDRVLAEAAEQATHEIAQLRALITDLRPAALDDLGIEAALEALVDRSRRASGLEIDIVTDFAFEAGRVAERHLPELETAIYRIVQEALTNAVRHAEATRIDVKVGEHDGGVEILVEDDGRGFDVQSRGGGFGLVGMRERVELERGTLQMTSRPGEGTRAEVTLPLRRRQV
jgi:signal transduction histidine kinase